MCLGTEVDIKFDVLHLPQQLNLTSGPPPPPIPPNNAEAAHWVSAVWKHVFARVRTTPASALFGGKGGDA